MASPLRLLQISAFALVFAIAACSSDDGPTGGGSTDTTPPGVTAVTPVDAFHVDVVFSEQVSKSSAENDANYSIVEAAAPIQAVGNAQGTPGDPMQIVSLSLKADKKTVAITTESSMGGLNYSLTIEGVSDTHGNSIKTPVQQLFAGSNNPDVTPPEIVSRSPAPGATNVPIGTTVTVQFSEPVDYSSFVTGASWTNENGPVVFDVQSEGATFALIPDQALAKNTNNTVFLTGIRDYANNTMADAQWTFKTTNTTDTAPPTLVSTTPANNATNVSVNTNFSLTFSEAVNQVEFNVSLAPDPGAGDVTWTNGGKTVNFDPVDPLLNDQQYLLTILPGGVRDLAGNGILEIHTVVFTTGSALESGSIAGLIAGDAGTAAADPTGATVIAADGSLFNGGGGDNLGLFGTATVTQNYTYTISHLPDGTYYPLVIMDSNGDGEYDPSSGDAIGAYGVASFQDITPDSVIITGGSHATEINFPILDPSAVTGTVIYNGIYMEGFWPIYVGLFDTTGWSPTDDPVVGTMAYWPYELRWEFNSFDQVFPDDQYYVAAFIDLNDDGNYDPATEPAGIYGGIASPTAINIANGSDMNDIIIPLYDPAPGMTAASVTWPVSKHNPMFKRLCDVVRRGQEMANK